MLCPLFLLFLFYCCSGYTFTFRGVFPTNVKTSLTSGSVVSVPVSISFYFPIDIIFDTNTEPNNQPFGYGQRSSHDGSIHCSYHHNLTSFASDDELTLCMNLGKSNCQEETMRKAPCANHAVYLRYEGENCPLIAPYTVPPSQSCLPEWKRITKDDGTVYNDRFTLTWTNLPSDTHYVVEFTPFYFQDESKFYENGFCSIMDFSIGNPTVFQEVKQCSDERFSPQLTEIPFESNVQHIHEQPLVQTIFVNSSIEIMMNTSMDEVVIDEVYLEDEDRMYHLRHPLVINLTVGDEIFHHELEFEHYHDPPFPVTFATQGDNANELVKHEFVQDGRPVSREFMQNLFDRGFVDDGDFLTSVAGVYPALKVENIPDVVELKQLYDNCLLLNNTRGLIYLYPEENRSLNIKHYEHDIFVQIEPSEWCEKIREKIRFYWKDHATLENFLISFYPSFNEIRSWIVVSNPQLRLVIDLTNPVYHFSSLTSFECPVNSPRSPTPAIDYFSLQVGYDSVNRLEVFTFRPNHNVVRNIKLIIQSNTVSSSLSLSNDNEADNELMTINLLNTFTTNQFIGQKLVTKQREKDNEMTSLSHCLVIPNGNITTNWTRLDIYSWINYTTLDPICSGDAYNGFQGSYHDYKNDPEHRCTTVFSSITDQSPQIKIQGDKLSRIPTFTLSGRTTYPLKVFIKDVTIVQFNETKVSLPSIHFLKDQFTATGILLVQNYGERDGLVHVEMDCGQHIGLSKDSWHLDMESQSTQNISFSLTSLFTNETMGKLDANYTITCNSTATVHQYLFESDEGKFVNRLDDLHLNGGLFSIKCFDLSSTDSTVCSGHGSCVNINVCQCSPGYFDDDCSVTTCYDILSNETSLVCHGNGVCDALNHCVCSEGFIGDECVLANCYGVLSNSSNVCSGHGHCLEPNNCDCDESYFGEQCDVFNCYSKMMNDSDVCSSHGNCIEPDSCQCSVEYYGEQCDQWNCFSYEVSNSSVCSSHGICTLPDVCLCQQGYFGDDCSTWECFGKLLSNESVCSANGKCISSNQCQCHQGFSGDSCDIPQCFGIQGNESTTCGGHGVCLKPNSCQCFEYFHGIHCNITECFESLSNYSDVCSGHGVCIEKDECICHSNWFDSICNTTICFGINSTVDQVCSNHGNCIAYNECSCISGYFGHECEIPSCFGDHDVETVCHGRGNCSDVDDCDCNDGYIGSTCELTFCFDILSDNQSVCSGKGLCLEYDQCHCYEGYIGQDCGEKTCFGHSERSIHVCSSHGNCSEVNQCLCHHGWIGSNCEIAVCYSIPSNSSDVCSGHGLCKEPDTCECDEGRIGQECNVFSHCKNNQVFVFVNQRNITEMNLFQLQFSDLQNYQQKNSSIALDFFVDTHQLMEIWGSLACEEGISFQFKEKQKDFHCYLNSSSPCTIEMPLYFNSENVPQISEPMYMDHLPCKLTYSSKVMSEECSPVAIERELIQDATLCSILDDNDRLFATELSPNAEPRELVGDVQKRENFQFLTSNESIQTSFSFEIDSDLPFDGFFSCFHSCGLPPSAHSRIRLNQTFGSRLIGTFDFEFPTRNFSLQSNTVVQNYREIVKTRIISNLDPILKCQIHCQLSPSECFHYSNYQYNFHIELKQTERLWRNYTAEIIVFTSLSLFGIVLKSLLMSNSIFKCFGRLVKGSFKGRS